MAKFADRVQADARRHLGPQETFLGAVRALPDGMRESIWWVLLGFLSLLIGLLVAGLIQNSIAKKWIKRASEAGFPGTRNMALILSDRRILVFARKGNRLAQLVGSVPVASFSSVRYVATGRRPEMVFGLQRDASVTVETFKKDQAERFVQALSSLLSTATRADGSMGAATEELLKELP